MTMTEESRGLAVDFDDPLYRAHLRRIAEMQMTDAPVPTEDAEPPPTGTPDK